MFQIFGDLDLSILPYKRMFATFFLWDKMHHIRTYVIPPWPVLPNIWTAPNWHEAKRDCRCFDFYRGNAATVILRTSAYHIVGVNNPNEDVDDRLLTVLWQAANKGFERGPKSKLGLEECRQVFQIGWYGWYQTQRLNKRKKPLITFLCNM